MQNFLELHSWIQFVGKATLLEKIGLPSDYPLHLDSIRAELYSREMSIYTGNAINYIPFLRHFLVANNQQYGDDLRGPPSKYAYAAANHPAISPHFGVSGPHKFSPAPCFSEAESVRVYRRRMCWGDGGSGGAPHERYERSWDHGHCAENQALPAVVARCEWLRLVYVEIETFAADKAGNPAPMCRNCEHYVYHRILKRNPGWVVIDKANGRRYVSSNM